MKYRKSLSYIAFLLLLACIAILYGFTNQRNLAKKIKGSHVDFKESSAHFLSESMVNKLLIQNKEPIKNQLKSKLDLHRIESKVLSNPYVESTSVYTTINGELFTQIKEHTPIARVLTKTASYYLGKEGDILPLSKNYAARVPLVTGVTKSEIVKEMSSFMRYIFEDDFLKKEITSVQKLPSNEFVLTARSGDYRIYFGNLEQTKQKFEKLKIFYSKALTDQTIFNYKAINLKFHNQVVGVK